MNRFLTLLMRLGEYQELCIRRSRIVHHEGGGQTAPHRRLALGRAVARPEMLIVLELHQQRLILLAADHCPAPVAATTNGSYRDVADSLTHSRHDVDGSHDSHATTAHGEVVLGTAGHGGRRLRGVRVVEVVQSHRGERVVVPMMMQVEFHKFGK